MKVKNFGSLVVHIIECRFNLHDSVGKPSLFRCPQTTINLLSTCIGCDYDKETPHLVLIEVPIVLIDHLTVLEKDLKAIFSSQKSFEKSSIFFLIARSNLRSKGLI